MSPIRLIAAGAALALSAPAFATDISEPFSGDRAMALEFHAGFTGYGSGLVGGGRFGIPIVDNGFIGPINNSVYINFGADFYLLSRVAGFRSNRGGIAIGLPVALQWNFYFSDDWSAYAEAGLNFYIDSYFLEGNDLRFGGSWLITAVGGRYHLNESMALIGRVGSPYLSFGIEISL